MGMQNTETGDKAEINIFEAVIILYGIIKVRQILCSGNKCPYKNECFFLKSRDEKES